MQESTTTCLNCGAPVRGRFCTSCGIRVEEPPNSLSPGTTTPSVRDPDATSTINPTDLRALLGGEPQTAQSEMQAVNQREKDATADSPIVPAGLAGEHGAIPSNDGGSVDDRSPQAMEPGVPVASWSADASNAQDKPRGPLTRLVMRAFSAFTGRRQDESQ